jgi:lipid II:glycine glycyltransferase (peptidoglycan interpeptide bridge formation enzyme)
MNLVSATVAQPVPAHSWQISLESLDPAVWSALLSGFADANFYQTHAYGSVAWGKNSLTHLQVRQETQVRALAQVRQIRLGRWFGVAYVRWGPCVRRRAGAWDGEAFQRALAALVEEYVQRRGWVLRVVPHLFRQDPEAGQAGKILRTLGFEEDASGPSYRTLRVDLTAPLETIRKRLDGKWRNQLNAAGRNGLEIRAGNDTRLFQEFRTLYDEMMSRKRFETSVDVADFEQMQEQLQSHEKLRVVLATRAGRSHAGLVATGLGETGIYLLGATGEEGLKSKASYLLQWQMIEHLKSAGCRFYDLGGINPQTNPGVYHFKSGMGGEEVVQLGRFERAPSAARRKLLHWAERFQRLWRRWRIRIRA